MAQLLAGDAISVDPSVVERHRRLLIPALEGLFDANGEAKRSHTNPGLAFGRAQVLPFNQIAAGGSERLHELHPEIVYLALAPFAGHDEAVRQARIAERDSHGGDPPNCGR